VKTETASQSSESSDGVLRRRRPAPLPPGARGSNSQVPDRSSLYGDRNSVHGDHISRNSYTPQQGSERSNQHGDRNSYTPQSQSDRNSYTPQSHSDRNSYTPQSHSERSTPYQHSERNSYLPQHHNDRNNSSSHLHQNDRNSLTPHLNNELMNAKMCRASNSSVSSSDSNSMVTSPPFTLQPSDTSTPAKSDNMPPYGSRRHLLEESDSSAFSRVQGGHDGNDSFNSPQYNRPRDTDNRLTPDARLDMLTRGQNSAFSPTSPQNGNTSQHSAFSSPRSRNGDMSIRSGQGTPSQTWNGGTPGQSSQPGPRPIKATAQYPPSSAPSQQSTPQRKGGNILVSRANIAPRPYGQKNTSVHHARPASAFAPASASVGNASFNNEAPASVSYSSTSRPPRQEARTLNPDHRNSLNQSTSNLRAGHSDSPYNSNANVNNNTPPSRSQINGRPKSVPPTMFNHPGGSDSESSYSGSYQQPHGGTPTSGRQGPSRGVNGVPPIPPPRQHKYTILPPGPPMTDNRPLPGTEPSGPTGPTGKELWYEYGCV